MSQQANGESWQKTRQRVLDRDGHACRFCGMTDDEHKEEYDSGLEAHHIIPDKEGGPDTPKNLITLCKSCHQTLEKTHARAVKVMRDNDSESVDRDDVENVFSRVRELRNLYDEKLAKYAKRHPVFADRVHLYNEVDIGASMYSPILNDAAKSEQPDIHCEFRCAAAYGYRAGLQTALSEIDTCVDKKF